MAEVLTKNQREDQKVLLGSHMGLSFYKQNYRRNTFFWFGLSS